PQLSRAFACSTLFRSVNFDSYNLDRIDYSRGPNAILFGNGTFGGNANVVTKRARHDSSFLNIKGSYGSWDYRRVTVDDNRPLLRSEEHTSELQSRENL